VAVRKTVAGSAVTGSVRLDRRDEATGSEASIRKDKGGREGRDVPSPQSGAVDALGVLDGFTDERGLILHEPGGE